MMSALRPGCPNSRRFQAPGRHFAFGPHPDMVTLFDHVVGAGEQGAGNRQL